MSKVRPPEPPAPERGTTSREDPSQLQVGSWGPQAVESPPGSGGSQGPQTATGSLQGEKTQVWNLPSAARHGGHSGPNPLRVSSARRVRPRVRTPILTQMHLPVLGVREQGPRGPPACTNHGPKVWAGEAEAAPPQASPSPFLDTRSCEDPPLPPTPSQSGWLRRSGEGVPGPFSPTEQNRKKVTESALCAPSGTFQHGKPTEQLGKPLRDFN